MTYRFDKSEGSTERTETVHPLELLARVMVHVREHSYVTTQYSAWIVACILHGSVIAQILAHLRTAT